MSTTPTDGLDDEGYVKFDCGWIEGPAPSGPGVADLIAGRNLLHALDLVGEYPDGIGFGNVSIRDAEGMIITGTRTGGVATLAPEHLTRVVGWSVEQNRLRCIGPVTASSESLTHAALYECSASIGAVVHVHSLEAWHELVDTLPTTRADVPYGTPEMARELQRLYRESGLPAGRVAVMAGHREGIIAFGASIAEAVEALLGAIDIA